MDGNNIIRLYREDSTYANLIFFWYVALVLLGIISASKKRIRIQQRFYSSKNIKLYIGWCFFIFCIAGLIFSRNHTDILYSIISSMRTSLQTQEVRPYQGLLLLLLLEYLSFQVVSTVGERLIQAFILYCSQQSYFQR